MRILFLLTLMLVASAAHAEGLLASANPYPAPSTGAFGQKKFEENTEITDAQLKATDGSLSQYSVRFNLTYSGPPIGDLSALEQPNPDGTVSNTATAITGTAGVRYRFDSQRSLSLVTGISNQYPFRAGSRFEASNPYLSYSSAFRLGGIQLVSMPGAAFITDRRLRSVSEWGSLNYVLSSVYDFNGSAFSVGLDATANYFFFGRDYLSTDKKVRKWAFGLSPNLKWSITPTFNVFTSVTFAYWNPRAVDERFMFNRNVIAGKVGVGYAATRDIYLTPYVGYYPEQASWKSTSVNFSAIVSVL